MSNSAIPLSDSDRVLVIESLKLRINQINRQLNAETDSSVAAIRLAQLSAVEALVSKFR